MASGKEGWTVPGGYPKLELGVFQMVDLPDGQVQLRFDSVAVPSGVTHVVPTLTMSKHSLDSIANNLKRIAAEPPLSGTRN